MKKIIRIIVILVLTAFALLTLFLSSSVIFDWFGIREREGNYVLVVVWANFISSLLYLLSVYGIIKQKSWAIKPLVISAIVLFIAGILFYFHINSGGIHETKTIGALTFRTIITLLFISLTYLTTIKWKQS